MGLSGPFILAFYSGILFVIYSATLFCHSMIFYVVLFLTFVLAFILAFSLVWALRDVNRPRQISVGPAAPKTWSSRLMKKGEERGGRRLKEEEREGSNRHKIRRPSHNWWGKGSYMWGFPDKEGHNLGTQKVQTGSHFLGKCLDADAVFFRDFRANWIFI